MMIIGVRRRGTIASAFSLALVFVVQTSCVVESDCFVDSDCGNGKICKNSKCVTGSRAGSGGDYRSMGGDPGYPADIDTVVGDYGPVLTTDGPEITILSPRPYELVYNVIEIRAKVEDRDGVDEGAVYAIVADRYHIQLRFDIRDEYTALFDTDVIGSMVYPVVDVTAMDIGGNSNTVGSVFSLDNEPPDISFRSAPMYAFRFGPWGTECSRPWQPVGEHALKDGDVVDDNYFYGLGMFPRLRIQDDGNTDFTHNMPVPVFGVAHHTAMLYALDSDGLAGGRKLLVGRGPGAKCEINPDVVPDPSVPDASDKAVLVGLAPLGDMRGPYIYSAIGLPNFTPVVPQPATLPDGCDHMGLIDTCFLECCHQPAPLCVPSQELTSYYPCYRGPQHPYDLVSECHPMIYGVGDFSLESDLICSGGGYDALNAVADGVVCLTAGAADRRGNLAFAAPIAICVDRDGVGGECDTFPGMISAADRCSDGCIPADDFGSESDAPTSFPYNEDREGPVYNHCY